MTDIKKYSKEHLALSANQKQKDAIKSISDNTFSELKASKSLTRSIFNADTLLGSREEVINKAGSLNQNSEEAKLIKSFGGIETVFDIVDENGDGTISNDEILSMAAVDSSDWEKENIVLSAYDMQQVYRNTLLSDGAEVKTEGNKTNFNYKNGSKATIVRDADGNVVRKIADDVIIGNKRRKTEYNYEDKVKTEILYDYKGRIISEEVDCPGNVHDKSTTIKYGNKNVVKTIDTVGRKEVYTYTKEMDLQSHTTKYKHNVNGEVEEFHQTTVGDCWLLSQTQSLSLTPIGKEIIKDSITQNSDGSVTVHLKGVDFTCTFSAEEVCSRDYNLDLGKYYSKGDDDVRVIEKAIQAYRLKLMEEKGEDYVKKRYSSRASKEDPLRGSAFNSNREAIYYLTGIKGSKTASERNIKNQILNKMNNSDRYALNVLFREKDASVGSYGAEHEFKPKIITNHEYAVSRVTEDTVYVINPWESQEEIAYPIESFFANCSESSIVDVSKIKKE